MLEGLRKVHIQSASATTQTRTEAVLVSDSREAYPQFSDLIWFCSEVASTDKASARSCCEMETLADSTDSRDTEEEATVEHDATASPLAHIEKVILTQLQAFE